jgi:hypothetical protein
LEHGTMVRIWVYGYKADMIFKKSRNTTAFNQAAILLENVINV